MDLSNSFTVDVPVQRAWEVLSDVPTIAPCLPGAQLQEVEGDEYRGTVKVKVGPIVARYKGAATFVERDESARRMVLRAEGKDTKGKGHANALITATLEPRGERTEVLVTTELSVSGQVAQFGRGVLGDVSAKLMGQFADNLAQTVLADGDAATGTGAVPDTTADAAAEDAEAPTGASPSASTNGSSGGVRTFDLPEPEPVDLLDAAGTPTLKRLVPPIVALLVVLVVIRLLRRRGG